MDSDRLLDQRQIPQHYKQQQVANNRNPRCFAAPRARQIILQLNQQMRDTRIQFTIRRFPVTAVVEAELLRLRFRNWWRRRHRILEWNLRNRHALDLGACHLDTNYTDGVASGHYWRHALGAQCLTANLTSILASFPPFRSF